MVQIMPDRSWYSLEISSAGMTCMGLLDFVFLCNSSLLLVVAWIILYGFTFRTNRTQPVKTRYCRVVHILNGLGLDVHLPIPGIM